MRCSHLGDGFSCFPFGHVSSFDLLQYPITCFGVMDERISLRSMDDLEMLRGRVAPDGSRGHLVKSYRVRRTPQNQDFS